MKGAFQMTSTIADILISGGLLVSGSSIKKMDVSVLGEKIVEVAPYPSGIKAKRVIDGSGLYVLPGLIDAHNHPISSMHNSWNKSNGGHFLPVRIIILKVKYIANIFIIFISNP